MLCVSEMLRHRFVNDNLILKERLNLHGFCVKMQILKITMFIFEQEIFLKASKILYIYIHIIKIKYFKKICSSRFLCFRMILME